MQNFITALTCIFLANVVQATELSVTIGAREQSADVGNLGDTGQKTSFQFGFEGPVLSHEKFSFISGASYVRRLITIRNSYPRRYSFFEANYLDVPLRAQYSVTDHFAIWGGASMAILLNSKCDSEFDDGSCDVKDRKQLMIPLSVGFNYYFTANFGLGMFYEMTSDQVPLNEISTDIKSYRCGGANLLYRF